MADTTVPSGSPAARKTWGGAKKKAAKPEPAAKTSDPERCSQFCTRLHQHTR